jgi:acyl carrier protein
MNDPIVMEKTITKIRKYILENFLFSDDEAVLCNDDSFLEKGIIDSTGILELMAFIGDEFQITIEDDEIIPENLDSVNCVASFILRKKTGNI